MIDVVAAQAGCAAFEGALRAPRAEHRGAVRLGAIVPHPVRQARAGAVGVVACARPAAIIRA